MTFKVKNKKTYHPFSTTVNGEKVIIPPRGKEKIFEFNKLPQTFIELKINGIISIEEVK